MKNYNLSKIMRRAWEIRKENSDNIFALCLKMAWAEAKGGNVVTQEEKIDELTKKFGRWTKDYNGKKYDRIYFGAKDLGLELEYYKSGNISRATIGGEEISNCEARRVIAAKAYLDLTDWSLHIDSTMEKHFGDLIRAEVA